MVSVELPKRKAPEDGGVVNSSRKRRRRAEDTPGEHLTAGIQNLSLAAGAQVGR